MVRQELKYWLYMIRIQKLFFLLPLLLFTIVLAANTRNTQLAKDFHALVLFPGLIFPQVAILAQIGSLHQKELFLTIQIPLFRYAIIRPLGLGVIYATFFTIGYMVIGGEATIYAVFIAALLLNLLSALCIALFKNIAVGISIVLILLLTGLFTTGSVLGPLYLMQWYRFIPGTNGNYYTFEQIIICAICLGVTFVAVKHRSRYHLL